MQVFDSSFEIPGLLETHGRASQAGRLSKGKL